MKITMIPLLLVAFSAAAMSAQEQTEWQLNAPYHCADGISYTITNRNGTGLKSMCQYREDQNGRHVHDVVTRCSQMTGMLQGCKVGGPPSAQVGAGNAPTISNDLNNTRYDCANGAAKLTVLSCQKQGGQDFCIVQMEMDGKFIGQFPKPRNEIEAQVRACKALPRFNPPYLAEFPTTYRVIQGMLVGNPQDNMVRAIGAFYQLTEILKVLAGQRGGGGYSSDEKKFLDDYSRLQSGLIEAASKKFPGEHFEIQVNPFHFSVSDPKFGFEGIPIWTTFLSPAAQARFAQVVGHNDAGYNLAVDQQKGRAIRQLDTDIRAAQADVSARKDAGSMATRHCIESGRSEMECLGEGLKIGAMDLIGGNPLKGIVPQTPVGLRLAGRYSAGGFSLMFAQDQVSLNCGALVQQSFPYSVDRAGDRLLIRIPISPKPIVLTYRTDGQIFGPGPVDVAGRVVIGGQIDHSTTTYEMQSQTTTTQRQIDAGDVPNYAMGEVHQNGMEYSVDQQSTSTSWAPTTTHQYIAPTAPKTERCNVSALPPMRGNVSVSGVLTQVIGTKPSQSTNTAPGLRLNGTYAAPGGLKIEFRDDSATLECGESFSSEGYEVVRSGIQFIVKFQNTSVPFSLVLQPNGSLTGSGNIDVMGHRAIQAASGGMDYLPRNARCALGTLEASQ